MAETLSFRSTEATNRLNQVYAARNQAESYMAPVQDYDGFSSFATPETAESVAPSEMHAFLGRKVVNEVQLKAQQEAAYFGSIATTVLSAGTLGVEAQRLAMPAVHYTELTLAA